MSICKGVKIMMNQKTTLFNEEIKTYLIQALSLTQKILTSRSVLAKTLSEIRFMEMQEIWEKSLPTNDHK